MQQKVMVKSPTLVSSISFFAYWTASSILFPVTYCRYDNQNTLTTVTAGTQGTGGRLISHDVALPRWHSPKAMGGENER